MILISLLISFNKFKYLPVPENNVFLSPSVQSNGQEYKLQEKNIFIIFTNTAVQSQKAVSV